MFWRRLEYIYMNIYIPEHKQNAHNDGNWAQPLKRLFESLFLAIKGLHFCEVHHSVASSTDESFKDETRLLLLWVGSLVTLHTLCSTIYIYIYYIYIYIHIYNKSISGESKANTTQIRDALIWTKLFWYSLHFESQTEILLKGIIDYTYIYNLHFKNSPHLIIHLERNQATHLL